MTATAPYVVAHAALRSPRIVRPRKKSSSKKRRLGRKISEITIDRSILVCHTRYVVVGIPKNRLG